MHGRKESALIIEKAEKKAEEIVGRAHEQARSIREGIRELRAMRKRFHHDMRDVLERVLRVIETDGEGGREVVGLYSVQDRAVPREIGGETEPAAETGEALLPEE
jgi:regulator of protease activity HflC (stomatin/prohibitin superfamily)